MKTMHFLLSSISLLTLVACGGGSSNDTATPTPAAGVISGAVTKGPVGNTSVAAYGISNGRMGAQIASTNSDANGNFTMTIGQHAGAVMLQISGGSYTDEATGTVMAMAPGHVMTAVMPSVSAGANHSGVQITPVTAMAQAFAQQMTGGMTDANIAAANAAMGAHFMVGDILHVRPMNPLVSGAGTGASQDAQNYGMTLAAMSQYAQTQGMPYSSAVVSALMNDASDGVLDGKAGAVVVQMGGVAGQILPSAAGTTGMAAAMNAFTSSARNKAGVTASALMSRLNGASGPLQGNAPTMMSAILSGTVFNGAVSQATVMAFAINSGAMGAQIASAAVDAQGNFSLPLGSYAGPVVLQVKGARYADAATRTTMTMGANDVMSAVLPMVSSGASVAGIWVTPVTSMAQARAMAMSGGMTDANIAAANAAMGSYFLVNDILRTQPMNPMVVGSGATAGVDARNYGMALAAMSQYAKMINMTVSSAFVTAMMSDAADGVVNGMAGATPITMPMGGLMGTGMMGLTAGNSSLVVAMVAFMNSSANTSGLTVADMVALMQRLNSSGGNI
ncbi:hypothetical protein [Rhodoferax sp.]|uniref:hypothetical protein n=1 Tax=Rhodoferax sp. TaxID=50421 RepID=UPI002749D488|nr:hypothetical protein [Rhodoferax sp.]